MQMAMHNAADHSTIIKPRLARRVDGKMRLMPLELLVVQPEMRLIHRQFPFGDLESGFAALENPVYGCQL